MKNLELQKILSNFPDNSEVNFSSDGFNFEVNSVQIKDVGTITLSSSQGWEKDLAFSDVGVYQFFVDSENGLMFKVDEAHALYLAQDNIIPYGPDEMILRIIKDLEIKEL